MAELFVIPALAVLGLYTINAQPPAKKKEGFNNELPNTNIPDINYPIDYPIINDNSELSITGRLSNINRYDGGEAYTDKFFTQNTFSNPPPSNPTTKYQSLTGPQDPAYFTHNNMTPFFGSKSRDTHTNNNVNEGLLDNMTGQGSQTITKCEIAPLFDSKDGINWANGMPNTSEFVRSRMNTSQYISNVQPFAQERVAPGLGLGAGTEGVGGFNSGLMGREQWIDKSVDELRVNTNPKSSGLSQLGFEGAPASYVKEMGALGTVEKNRPETTFELGMERSIGALSANKGNSIHGEVIDRFVNRPETDVSYAGIAGPTSSGTATQMMDGEYMPSHRKSLGALPVGGANGTHNYHLANMGDFGLKATVAYPNNRSTNYNEDYFGAVVQTVGSIMSPIMDVLKPNRKNNVVGTLRPYQNPSAKVKNSYVLNTHDRTPTTNREMTDQGQNLWIVNSSQYQNGSGYMTNRPNPTENQRDTTTQFSYMGTASAKPESRQPRNYEAEYNQSHNGVRESTIKNSGYTPSGGISMFNSNVNGFNNNSSREMMNAEIGSFQNAPKSASALSPSIELIGRSMGGSYLYDKMGLDRNTNDTMGEILKQNPYAIQVSGKR